MPVNSNGERRPNPEALLEKIRSQEKKCGELTVFLGAAAGVGKTFTMLKTAHDKRKENVDIVIGWVETHGRAETENMAQGILRIPPRQRLYKGRSLPEMDLDAILARRPQIVIVDELAHTNVEGSRHRRRYQDVEELLAAGIDVYTAINIQHIESLNDVVAQITGVAMRETVPDAVLERASAVQLIDIAPEELLKRFRDGKIYLPEQARRAMKSFFRVGNITALRELALRFTAQRVDKEMEAYMRRHNIQGPWQTSGRVLVGVSGSPFSAQLIRAAARLAAGLRSELLAVHVEEARARFPVGDRERDRIAKNLRLAEELGAKTMTIVGETFIGEFLEIARRQNVTAIVVGKPQHSRWFELRRGSVVDRIIRESGDINVYVIRGRKEAETASPVETRRGASENAAAVPYLLSVTMVGALTGLIMLLHDYLEPIDGALLYIIPVLFSAVLWGRWPSYLAALAGVLMFDLLFVDPLLTFDIANLRSLWSFLIFLLISFLIGGRTEKLRSEMRQARRQERNTRAVYEFSREIAAVSDAAAIAASLVRQAGETIDRKVIAVLMDEAGAMGKGFAFDPGAPPGRQISEAMLSEEETGVIDWVYAHRKPAGRSADTLPGGTYLYIPLCSQEKAFGVFGVGLDGRSLTPGERRLVEAWTRLAAVAIERAGLSEKARQANLLIEADRLRGALFNSISHELKTPLSAIIGSVSTLLEADSVYSAQDRCELLHNIRESSLRMNRLIVNLLDTARMESGMLRLKSDWCDIQDVIGAALRRLGDIVGSSKLTVELADDLPLLQADCVLLEQVLINLIDNAVKYSNDPPEITIRAAMCSDEMEISVLDRGSGMPEEDLGRVFDKFYRAKQPRKISGTGLGLAICRGIVEAHGGRIYAENRGGGGSVIRFVLPVKPYEKQE